MKIVNSLLIPLCIFFAGCDHFVQLDRTTLSSCQNDALNFISEADYIVRTYGKTIWPDFYISEDYITFLHFSKDGIEIKKELDGSFSIEDNSELQAMDNNTPYGIYRGKGYRNDGILTTELFYKPIDTYEKFLSQSNVTNTPERFNEYLSVNGYENSIVLIVHELFHLFQNIKMKDHYPFYGKEFDRLYENNYINFSEQQAKLNRIERLSLVNAYFEKEKKSKETYIANYLCARSLKKKGLKGNDLLVEEFLAKIEGTAQYFEECMNNLLDKDYKSLNNFEKTEFFTNFSNRNLQNKMKFLFELECLLFGTEYSLYSYSTYDASLYYKMGNIQCLILDELDPLWKSTFDWKNESLDDVFNRVINYDITYNNPKRVPQDFPENEELKLHELIYPIIR